MNTEPRIDAGRGGDAGGRGTSYSERPLALRKDIDVARLPMDGTRRRIDDIRRAGCQAALQQP